MEDRRTLHVHNQPGVARVRIGVRKFMCIGALPPLDHPHVYIDMGEQDEARCPYCATQFVFDARLGKACDPPECAYTPELESMYEGDESRAEYATEQRGGVTPSVAQAVEIGLPATGGVIGSFETEAALRQAVGRIKALGVSDLQTFTPRIYEQAGRTSLLPWIILIGGLIGAAGGFAMETYANVAAYPLDIGGRPKFSWPSFVPIAFEIGVLVAVLCAIGGTAIAGGFFKYYDSIDEFEAMRGAMRDCWVVLARTDDPRKRAQSRAVMESLNARNIEEVEP